MSPYLCRMASLSALRNKFKKLEEQKKAEEELTGNTNRFSSSDDTGNNTGFTAEITGKFCVFGLEFFP